LLLTNLIKVELEAKPFVENHIEEKYEVFSMWGDQNKKSDG
jgi:hypothetical protein